MSTSTLPVRATDPETSYEAAVKAAMGASSVRPVVLSIVQEHGPLTHDEVIWNYNRLRVVDPATPPSSESGICTRLRELREKGLIEADPVRGQSKFGNKALRWIAVEEDVVVAFAVGAAFYDDSDSSDEDDHTGPTEEPNAA